MDRKKSPLVTSGAPWDDIPKKSQEPSPTPVDQQKHSTEPPLPAVGDATVVRIKEGSRRKRLDTSGVDPFELRPVNYNLPLITRRTLRRFAAEQDVDIQDVVNDALIRYFALFGITVPRTREELRQLQKSG